ncbi:Uncharacterized protein APZ42_004245, partial [Daphnia magna]
TLCWIKCFGIHCNGTHTYCAHTYSTLFCPLISVRFDPHLTTLRP